MLPVHLREPCNEPARRRAAATLARRALAPAFDRAALKRDRKHAARHTNDLARELAAALERHGIPVTRAATAAAAAGRIAAIAAGSAVAVTRAAVLGELHAALCERGIGVVTTYGPREADFIPRLRRFWQLPRHGPATSWRTEPVSDWDGERRDVVGLLGVNAASAATGTLYLVQHSTNIGDLLRSARLLVFVVGMDKITTDDAAARRQAEAISTYGTESVLLDIGRTRPPGTALDAFPPLPGSPQAEVILLDNGRTGLRRGPYRSLLECIGCRACATRCPTYPAFRGPRGWSPKDYLWSHIRGENPSLALCTFCGNCEVDCPVDIPLPTMIAERRAEAMAERGRRLAEWRLRVEGDVERVAAVFSATAPLSGLAQRLPLAATTMEKVFGLAPERQLPPFRRATFERRHAKHRKGRSAPRAGTPPRLVYYFGCFANYSDPEVGQAAVGILETLGYDVILPPWRCCGIPLYAKGEIDAARRLATANVASLVAYADAGYEIVTSCPSCHLALARDYPRLFPSPAAERVAARSVFLSRFLLARQELGERLGATPARAAYHLPCHLRALGMEEDSLRLLREVPGLELADLGRGCCGLSGTFGLARAHYAESMEIGGGLFAAVREGSFDLVVTDCGACKLQIEHGTGRQVTHPLQVAHRALLYGRRSARASGIAQAALAAGATSS